MTVEIRMSIEWLMTNDRDRVRLHKGSEGCREPRNSNSLQVGRPGALFVSGQSRRSRAAILRGAGHLISSICRYQMGTHGGRGRCRRQPLPGSDPPRRLMTSKRLHQFARSRESPQNSNLVIINYWRGPYCRYSGRTFSREIHDTLFCEDCSWNSLSVISSVHVHK